MPPPMRRTTPSPSPPRREKGGYTFTGWTIGEQTFEAGAQIVLDSSLTAQADENGVITVTAQFSRTPSSR